MRLGQIFAVLRRRWHFIALGVLVSLGLGYGALLIDPPVYVAKGSTLLLPSDEQLNAGGRNPFLHLDSLTGPASIVIARLSGTQAADEVKAVSPKAEFVIEPDPAMRGPGILVTVTDVTPESALKTLDVVLKKVSDTLDQVQTERKVPSDAIVGSMRLVVDSKAERDLSGTLRAVVAVFVAGLALTAALVFSLDGLSLRRRLRRVSETAGGDEPSVEEAADSAEVERPAAKTRARTSRHVKVVPSGGRTTVSEDPEEDAQPASGDDDSVEASPPTLAGRSSRRVR